MLPFYHTFSIFFCFLFFSTELLPWQRSAGDIMIRNIQLRHAGKYTCAVQTKVDSVSIATDVVVRGKDVPYNKCLKKNLMFQSDFLFWFMRSWRSNRVYTHCHCSYIIADTHQNVTTHQGYSSYGRYQREKASIIFYFNLFLVTH